MFPSAITLNSYYGYYDEIFAGWKKLDEATIKGDGYTVDFYRLSERTIDPMCDALNGWENIWTKFRCEYKDQKGTIAITVHKPEDADKLFNMLFENERGEIAVDTARTKLEKLVDIIRQMQAKQLESA